MSTRLTTPPFLASYVYVWKPRNPMEGQAGDPKYSVLMLFDKSQDINIVKLAIKEAVQNKWGGKPPKGLRNPIRDGDAEHEGDSVYENRWFIRASSKTKPGVLNRDKERITNEDDFFSGCIAVATINAFAYDNSGNKGVSFGLNNIIKLRSGPRLDGHIDAEDDFDDVDVESYEVPEGFGSDDEDFGF